MSLSLSRKWNWFYFLIGFGISIGITTQAYFSEQKSDRGDGRFYTEYNNYVIFKCSFKHLREDQNLYAYYPDDHWDLYKYTPTFALAMASFFFLPEFLGLFLWNFLGASVLIYGLSLFHFPSVRLRFVSFVFILPELITSMQNEQSNNLIAGLMLCCFAALMKSEIWKASLFILIAAFIKPFSLVLFLVFLLFPGKIKMAYTSGFWLILLLLAPLLLVSLDQLFVQYENWIVMLESDHSSSLGYSVLGWFQSWFELDLNKVVLLLVGLVIMVIPFIRLGVYSNTRFRLLSLASVFLWVILFNHKSESPTFILAAVGVMLWFFTKEKYSKLDIILVVFTWFFTCLIATEAFPYWIRKEYAEPYVWKVVPCILVWLKIVWEMLTEPQSTPKPI